jgi:hypothetical protein
MITLNPIIASFTVPENIPTTPSSLLWLLPLVAALVVVYKATKLEQITLRAFVKDSVSLFLSIVVFIAVIAVALYSFAWLFME